MIDNTTHKKILDVVENILGSEILCSPVQNTRIKQPEKKLPKGSIYDGLSGRTPWHQDAAVLTTHGQKFCDMVTVWIPFTKTTKKNGCMITVKQINKMGLLNHISGYRGQVVVKNSKLLDKFKPTYLEANVGDIILLHKHSIHCSLPNRSNNFRISADFRYNRAGTPSGREALPNFYVRSKNKKNIIMNGMNILDLVLQTKLGDSKSEIRRMIKNHGLKINNEVITEETKTINQSDFDQDNNMKVSHGKKQHVIVKII